MPWDKRSEKFKKEPMRALNMAWSRWWTVVVFAAAMAWVEAAVVYYLRTMVNRIDPYVANPLPLFGGLGQVELVRELATLIMLATVGLLAGRSWSSRIGFTAIAFGTWDIFYYVFLRVICGWPHSLLDWDILFLIPVPWWGPVVAPISISLLMIAWGTLVNGTEHKSFAQALGGKWVLFGAAGIMVALYTFMCDSLRVADQGTDALRNLLPTRFKWLLFISALSAMASPAIVIARRSWFSTRQPEVPQ
jgi:hypothetical protein